MTVRNHIAQRVGLWRVNTGRANQELCEKLGISRAVLSQAINESKSSKWFAPIAKEMGCSYEWLVHGTGEAPTWAVKNLTDQPKGQGATTCITQNNHDNNQIMEAIRALALQQTECMAKLARLEALVSALEGVKGAAVRRMAEVGR